MTAPRPAGAFGRALGLVTLAALLGAGSGCVTLIRTTQGTAPTLAALQGIPVDADLGVVLERLGAPSEAWRDRDGTILVYRERSYAYERVGLDPSRGLTALGLQQTASSALSNVRLVFEFGDLREARLVALLGSDGKLETLAYVDAEGQRWMR